MESLYLFIPMSLVVVGFIVFILYWSVRNGQFEDLEGPGHAILMDDDNPKPQLVLDKSKQESNQSTKP